MDDIEVIKQLKARYYRYTETYRKGDHGWQIASRSSPAWTWTSSRRPGREATSHRRSRCVGRRHRRQQLRHRLLRSERDQKAVG